MTDSGELLSSAYISVPAYTHYVTGGGPVEKHTRIGVQVQLPLDDIP
jgi:hypothetical protein